MEQNRNDRGNSSEQRKKLSYAKEHMKGRKFRVVRPEHRSKNLEYDDNAINAVLGTLTGGHHDTVRRFDNTSKYDSAQVSAATDPEKVRRMQKAMYIRQQLMQEESGTGTYRDEYTHAESAGNAGVSTVYPITQVYSDISDDYGRYADRSYGYEVYEEPSNEHYSDTQNDGVLQSEERPEESSHRLTDSERAVIESGITHTVDPETGDRYRKAQFIREKLLQESKAAAFAVYDTDENAESLHGIHEVAEVRHSDINDLAHEQSSDGAEPANSISVALSAAPIITDEIKQDIIRGIKSEHFKDRLEERRKEQANEKQEEPSAPQPRYTKVYQYDSYENADKREDITTPIETAASYISTVQSGNAQSIVTRPVTDIIKQHMGEGAVIADSLKQAANTAESSDSTQAVPFNIGMILAENEGKKLAYKIAKGEDILAEKEHARVNERMAQSKYRFVEPDKHTPKVEKRETIQEEQKRRFIKNTENKKAEVRREAEHKAKENIYLKANRREDGLIGKIFGDEKTYHPKSKAAVIAAGAGAAIIPVLLIIVVIMFICSLFLWMSPNKEKLFDESSMSYKEEELSGEEVITGYVKVVKDVFDEKQLEILAMITSMDCDHDMLDNKWIKLDENFDIESIIAIEAAKKWREIRDSRSAGESEEPGEEEAEEEAEDIIYHLTREDFKEVVDMTFNFDAREETRECDECEGEKHVEFDPDTGEFHIVTTPCVHTFLVGEGVNNLASLAGQDGDEYYFFDKVFDKESETYEEDKMMYDLYREVLQKNILGTTDQPSHTIVDYSDYSQDYQRMMKAASALGYTVMGDKVTKRGS